MKFIMSILSLVAVFFISSCSSTQQSSASSSAGLATESFKVTGVCDMCKRRIETAAYGVSGVKSAEWNADNQLLKVSYDSKKANAESVLNRVAAAGHDTEKIKADDKAYSKLPDCCKYRDGVEVHKN
jgi:periplasmic mercuric ion binding protein